VSAETVHARVAAQFPQVNISTVYRTLELLQNLGLVTHTHSTTAIALYHLAEDSHHQHMVCRRCGHETEIAVSELATLDQHLQSTYGFHADLTHFAIIGTCKSCHAVLKTDAVTVADDDATSTPKTANALLRGLRRRSGVRCR